MATKYLCDECGAECSGGASRTAVVAFGDTRYRVFVRVEYQPPVNDMLPDLCSKCIANGTITAVEVFKGTF